jgi:sialate O-acetylesterase
MVLQRGQPVPVWGSSAPGTRVTVAFAHQQKSTLADGTGAWRVLLDPLEASSEPRPLRVTALPGEQIRTFDDVLVGDVWLCSGQSNMAMTVDGPTKWLHVGGVSNARDEVQTSANPAVRQFYVHWKTHTQPQTTCSGTWTVADPSTTALFSATGYFFARELQQRLRIPIAILNASWGGSSIGSWISRGAHLADGDSAAVARIDQIFHDYDHHDSRLQQHVAALRSWQNQHDRAAPLEETPPFAESDSLSWPAVSLPAPVSQMGCPHGGVLWLEREFEIPQDWGSAWRLDFPACRAFSAIHVNGTRIFEASATNGMAERASRPTLPPKVARPGKNRILIRLHAQAGSAGITGGLFALVPFNPAFASLPMAGAWRYHVQKTFNPLPAGTPPPPSAPVQPVLHWLGVPAQFNAMVHPLLPFAIKGVAWYQGESNVGDPEYGTLLHRLIGDWRYLWANPNLPFLLCQLPAFGPPSSTPSESPWAECREAQMSALRLPHTGIAPLLDTCEDGDLHPLDKQSAGRRLARVALARVYGADDVPASGPLLDGWTVRENTVHLTFHHATGGLRARPLPAEYRPNLRKPEIPAKSLPLPSPGSPLQGFTLCEMRPQPDGSQTPHWENAQARIEGDTVVVWSPRIQAPAAVRYAWADHPVCNLENAAGLPAFPFRTDSFRSAPRPKR